MKYDSTIPPTPLTKERIGKKFHRLTVTKYLGRTADYKAWILAECDCGTLKEFYLDHLTRKNQTIKSCGCYNKELAASRLYKHGETRRNSRSSPEFNTWSSMKQRCYYKKHKDYESYGGRGIVVCDEWKTDFSQFLKDMGRRPSLKHSIERKDNDGNYEPSNCKWATMSEQIINRRNTRTMTYKGETKPARVWAEELGMSWQALRSRIYAGWSDERALTQPVRFKIN